MFKVQSDLGTLLYTVLTPLAIQGGIDKHPGTVTELWKEVQLGFESLGQLELLVTDLRFCILREAHI